MTLFYGDTEYDERWLSIATRADVGHPDPPGYQRRDELVRELLRAQSRPPQGLDLQELHRWHLEERRRIDQVESPPWSPVVVSIDGGDVAGEVAEVAGGWVLVATRNDWAIDVVAKGPRPDAIPLTRVATLRPYIEGLQALQRGRHIKYGE